MNDLDFEMYWNGGSDALDRSRKSHLAPLNNADLNMEDKCSKCQSKEKETWTPVDMNELVDEDSDYYSSCGEEEEGEDNLQQGRNRESFYDEDLFGENSDEV